MKILVMKVDLRAAYVHSLKEKRMIVKSIIGKLQNKFNVSIREVENQDFLEPSAGCGNFLNYLHNYLALDILPEDDRIQQQDFLTFNTDKTNYVSIGNPPFGKGNTLSVRRLYKSNKAIILQAMNPKYQTIVVNVFSEDMILGKVETMSRDVR